MNKKSILTTLALLFGFLSLSWAQVPSYVPKNGLIGWWPFNGNANDESGNGNNGTVYDAILSADRFGNANKAYNFNSNNNTYIQAAIGIQDTLTFSAWFKCGAPTSYYGMIYSYGDASATGATYSGQIMGPHPDWLSTGHVGKLHPYAYNNGYLAEIIPTRYSDSNNWHNAIITYIPNDKIYLYYDGVFISNTPLNAFPIKEGIVTFGRDLNNNAGLTVNQGKFDGIIDDIGIWNRALTQQEITDLYKSASLGNRTHSSLGFSISPNPVKNTVNIKCSARLSGSAYVLYDNTGKSVLSGKISSENTTIDLNTLSPGMYWISVGGNNRESIKIIKE